MVQLGLAHPDNLSIANTNLPACRRRQSADTVQQRRLARPRHTHDRQNLAGGDPKVRPLQNLLCADLEPQIADFDPGRVERVSRFDAKLPVFSLVHQNEVTLLNMKYVNTKFAR